MLHYFSIQYKNLKKKPQKTSRFRSLSVSWETPKALSRRNYVVDCIKESLRIHFPTASSLEKYKAQCIFCHAIKDRQETSEVWRPEGFFVVFHRSSVLWQIHQKLLLDSVMQGGDLILPPCLLCLHYTCSPTAYDTFSLLCR